LDGFTIANRSEGINKKKNQTVVKKNWMNHRTVDVSNQEYMRLLQNFLSRSKT
jgi:hypothetical protein